MKDKWVIAAVILGVSVYVFALVGALLDQDHQPIHTLSQMEALAEEYKGMQEEPE